MAKTYCTCVGMRGEVTYRGGNDGVRVSAQAWDGSIIVRNWYDSNEVLNVSVGTNDGSSSCYVNGPQFRGTFTEFENLLKLSEQIKNGEVSVVHHRKRK